ncbi:hypothetical protein HaLaN_01277, partial [Haematococcus lacustris]
LRRSDSSQRSDGGQYGSPDVELPMPSCSRCQPMVPAVSVWLLQDNPRKQDTKPLTKGLCVSKSYREG